MAPTDTSKTLAQMVHDAMDCAEEQGFGENMRVETATDIAINILDYNVVIFEAAQSGDIPAPSVMDVIPHVESWRAARAN